MSNVLSDAATLTNLTSRDRWLFGRYRGHPVGVYQKGKMEGNQMIFQVLLASPAVQDPLHVLRLRGPDDGRVDVREDAPIRVEPDLARLEARGLA